MRNDVTFLCLDLDNIRRKRDEKQFQLIHLHLSKRIMVDYKGIYIYLFIYIKRIKRETTTYLPDVITLSTFCDFDVFPPVYSLFVSKPIF